MMRLLQGAPAAATAALAVAGVSATTTAMGFKQRCRPPRCLARRLAC
jgi:hypothetical protein